MDEHRTYDKEKVLKTPEGEEKKEEKFIWSYMIRPVRKDFEDKWMVKHSYLTN